MLPQEYSIASLRMLHPNLFPLELILSAHDKFLGHTSDQPRPLGRIQKPAKVPQKVLTTVEDKAKKFPWSGTIHLIKGLLLEGRNEAREALDEYALAVHLSASRDWQPQWRLGLLQQRVGLFASGNKTLSDLLTKFDGIGEMYRDLGQLSEEPVARGPLYVDRALLERMRAQAEEAEVRNAMGGADEGDQTQWAKDEL